MQAAGSQITIQHILPLVVLFITLIVMFWLIVIRPANKRTKEHIELIRSLTVGDRVVTAGGIHGVIRKIGERTVEVEVANGVVLRLDKYAIRKRQED